MTIPPIPSELFYKFNDVKYYDEPHKYYVDNKQLISVTTIIHQYEEEFDEVKWSKIKGEHFGIPAEEVSYGWKFINEKATTKGSIIHDYAENLFLNKYFPYPIDEVNKKFGYDPVFDEFLLTKKHVDKFYKDSFNKLIPIKTELVVYDKEFGIGGMVDLLFFNLKSGKFEIWDWKTNSSDDAFSNTTKSGVADCLSGPLFMVPNTDIGKYSLQLSTYKYIIEKYCNIKLGDSYLIWISYKNKNYEIKKCEDYTNIVPIMFEDYKRKTL